MSQIVSITSQGQISIPAQMRRLLGLDVAQKAYVTHEDGKIIVEPIPDFLVLAGSLNSVAIKNKSVEEIELLEKKAIKEARTKKYSNEYSL
ncbi:AbrB/MazE/SpoVT family DNA-binding domain-containing protein [Patescibacteria group bacterium]|nr:AbrB/MazE/SpoVT family DNA-binding domain-containing protein [Patescibacteria group bacterium]